MPDLDYDKLGKSIAEHMHSTCPIGWSKDDMKTLSEFAAGLRSAKATAWVMFIRVLVLGAIGVFLLGIRERLKGMLF